MIRLALLICLALTWSDRPLLKAPARICSDGLAVTQTGDYELTVSAGDWCKRGMIAPCHTLASDTAVVFSQLGWETQIEVRLLADSVGAGVLSVQAAQWDPADVHGRPSPPPGWRHVETLAFGTLASWGSINTATLCRRTYE